MKNKLAYGVIVAATASLAAANAEDIVKPTLMSAADINSDIFTKAKAEVETKKTATGAEYTIEDYMPFTSSDEKLFVGMYRTVGHHRFEVNEPYGVDEYMHFIKGGVTLTSSDGSVIEVKAGDSVSIPKEWTGVWESGGYEKIYVIYETTSAEDEASGDAEQ